MQLATENMIAEKEDGIGWMIFNNPERHNALSVEMRHAMLQILDDFAADDAIRVVVMKGAGGRAFVSSADISQFEKQRATEAQRKEYSQLSDKVHVALTSLQKPMLAMINGFCLGGGLATALTADIRIAAEDARFGIPAARLGLGYPFGALRSLVDLVGPACTKEILFTGNRFDAAEALRIGLVNQVVAADELGETVRKMAGAIAANAPLTVGATKAIVAEVLKNPDDRDLAMCERLVEGCMSSEDYVEGRRAFMDKRRPQFAGR